MEYHPSCLMLKLMVMGVSDCQMKLISYHDVDLSPSNEARSATRLCRKYQRSLPLASESSKL